MFSLFILLFLLAPYLASCQSRTCHVPSSSGGDDTPAILSAFRTCGHDGIIIFGNATYNVHRVMDTTGLRNVRIELWGKLLWSKDTNYWLANSLPVGYQNQSTAWYLGGENVTFDGFGVGTIDGNGQIWYDLVKGKSNYARRPHALTITKTTNSVFTRLRFVQSQMWTMTIIHSSHILLSNIYVNSTSHSKGIPSRNTDGADTIYSSHITFRHWTVVNGDDGIALKANSTNILIEDVEFHGLGFALGSIGQYKNVFETIENVIVKGVRYYGTRYPAYIKTWTGVQKGVPPNGGGGGLGFIRNITLTNIITTRAEGIFSIDQCTHFRDGGVAGDCDTSHFQIRDVTIANVRGEITKNFVARLKCSPKAPCTGMRMEDVEVKTKGEERKADKYSCANVVAPRGIKCGG